MSAFTEKAIVDAFVSLLNEHPLDKITVKNIIDKCGVNRSTFYYYFEDIYDLINKIFEYETGKIVNKHSEYESWADGIKEAMSFAIDNKKAIYHVYKSVSRERLNKYLNEVCDSIFMEVVYRMAVFLTKGKASVLSIRTSGQMVEWLLLLLFTGLQKGMGLCGTRSVPDCMISEQPIRK